jgi:hypothetical protein
MRVVDGSRVADEFLVVRGMVPGRGTDEQLAGFLGSVV